MTEQHDYIVVGAGSAGCVIARRLIDAGKTVLLLEAGPLDNSLFVKMPATFIRVLGSRRTWLYQTTPQKYVNHRQMYVPQGRTLGGSSSVNAMIYIRGDAADYNDWEALGCRNWGYDHVLPYFIKSEENQLFSNQFHGNEGLLKVNHTPFKHPLSQAFIKAAQEVGIPYNPDFNGASQLGVGFYQTTTFNGERGSTATTYLKPIMGQVKLCLKTEVMVTRLVFDEEKVNKVIGLEYQSQTGEIHMALAKKSVILCAGALSSPKILMLSGIGNQADLASHHITLKKHLAGVGQNFQDHLEISVYARTKDPISFAGNDRGLKAYRHGVQWLLTRTGLLSSNVVESGGFIDSTGQNQRADIQFHVLPTLVGDIDRAPMAGHGISINPCFIRPKSRGRITLNSGSAQDPIIFDGGFLSHEDDLNALVRGVKLARQILRAPALQKMVIEELGPSKDANLSDDAIKAWIFQHTKTVYHPSGTCKMGVDDLAVVDPELKVHGIENLRIADASIMPLLVSGNTNAACIMIGERCADFLLKDA